MGGYVLIPVDADMTLVYQKLNEIGIKTQQIATQTKHSELNLLRLYSYSAHIASLITQMGRRMSKGTEEAVGWQIAALGISALTTEVAIGTTIAQAMAAFATHQYVQGGMLIAAAGMMQVNLAQNLVAQGEAIRLKQYIASVSDQYEAWR